MRKREKAILQKLSVAEVDEEHLATSLKNLQHHRPVVRVKEGGEAVAPPNGMEVVMGGGKERRDRLRDKTLQVTAHLRGEDNVETGR